MTPYLATLTRRWHTNAHLGHTGDTLASHGGRMAVLSLMIWRDPNPELLAACVTHDLGEYITGDVPYGAPNKDSKAELDALEDMGMLYPLCPEDSAKLKLLDLLDAYLWARHHAPFAMVSQEWIDHREKVLALADKLGVSLHMFGVGYVRNGVTTWLKRMCWRILKRNFRFVS